MARPPLVGRGWFVGYVGDILVVHARVEVEDADFATYLEVLAEAIDQADEGRRTAVLYDLSRGSSTTAQRRKRVAEVVESRREKLKRVLAGCAIATPSPVTRGIATAVIWLTSPPWEVRFVPSARDAFAWFGEILPHVDGTAAMKEYEAMKTQCCGSSAFG